MSLFYSTSAIDINAIYIYILYVSVYERKMKILYQKKFPPPFFHVKLEKLNIVRVKSKITSFYY